MPSSDGTKHVVISYALLIVHDVEKGNLIPLCEATVECPTTRTEPGVQTLQTGQDVRVYADADFRLLEPDGFDMVSEKEDREVVDTRRLDSWLEVRRALHANWMSSKYLRLQRPPQLGRSQRQGLSGRVILTRDITTRECGWLERDLLAGEEFRVYTGHTYGVISRQGIAVQALDEVENGPFMELPASALQNVP
jgi:hypothetical protein